MIFLSLVVSVLNSHEIVRRQLLHLSRVLTNSCELILVDDGGDPSLRQSLAPIPVKTPMVMFSTKDERAWTQPRGRNIGARIASADTLLFFDIDHIVTEEIIEQALRFQGDCFQWKRRLGILCESGEIQTDLDTLSKYGKCGDIYPVHLNSFVIRRQIWKELDGYDERFCGQYGGDDIDFNDRYQQLVEAGKASPKEVLGEGYVFPDPGGNRKIFHDLDRK